MTPEQLAEIKGRVEGYVLYNNVSHELALLIARDAVTLCDELESACGCYTFDQNLIECEYHAAQSDELRAANDGIARLRTAYEQALALVYPRGEVWKILAAALGKE